MNPNSHIVPTRLALGVLALGLAVPVLAQDAPQQTPVTEKTPARQTPTAKGGGETGTQMSTAARDAYRAQQAAEQEKNRQAKLEAAAQQAQAEKGAPIQKVDPNAIMPSLAPTAAQAGGAPAPAAPMDNRPAIKFEPEVLDLGEMIADVAKTGTIKIVNILDTPIKVTKITPGCGCTTSSAPPGEIAPGGSANVDITLKPGPKAGIPLTKQVTFTIDGHPPQILTVRGDVKAFVAISQDMIDGPSSPDAPPTAIKLTGMDNTAFKVTGALPDVLVALPEGSKMEHEVQIDWKKWEANGSSVKIAIMTDHPKAPQLSLLVKRALKPGVVPPPATAAGEAVPATVTAVRANDMAALKKALDTGTKVDDPERMSKRTALHFAAEAGSADAVKALLAAKASPNAQDRTGKTPVTMAAEKGKADVLKLLLASGGDANARDQVQGSPLLWASGLGTVECVQVLLDAGANPNIADVNGMTPLMWAAGVGKPEVVTALIAKGADVKATDKLAGETALMRAIRSGKLESVKLILAKGGDLNTKNTMGMTPFLIACGYATDLDKIKLLIDAKCDVTAKDARGWGAIDHARNRVDTKRDEVVKFLEPIVPASTATVQPPSAKP